MSQSEKPVSFSLSSSKPKPSSSKPNPKFDEETREDDPQREYVTEFSPSKTLTTSAQIVVTSIENSWNLHGKKKRNLDPSLESEEVALQFELENPSSAPVSAVCMSRSEKPVSFSFSSSKPRPSSTKPNPKFDEETRKDDPQRKYVTEFDVSKTLTPSPQIVVAPLENSWSLHGKKKRNFDPSLESEEAALQFELENPSSAPDPASHTSYGLHLRTKENGDHKPSDPRRPSAPNSIEDVALQKLREDLSNFPDDRGADEFRDVPIDGFGAALLAGYGWSEGQGIGRNSQNDVQVVQYLRLAGREGIGFVPDLPDANQKRKRGSGHGSDPPLVAPVGPDGRTRHVIGIDEKLVPREYKGVFVGKVVRVVDGRHAGLKGEVVEKSGSDSESQKVVLKLLKSGEEVRVGLNQVAEVGSVEEEKYLRKLQEMKSRGKEERRGSLSRGHKEKRDGEREDGRRDKRRRRDKERERDRKESQLSSRDGGDGQREEVQSPVSWLASHIRVKIVSKEFKGGKLYLKKGVIMDVIGRTKCDISMDENKELIQGVDQEILETAIPKRGGPVLVLYGKHKGIYGSLVESDKDRETGVVREADTHELLNVRLEQIAEYIGDPCYLGY